MNRRNFIKNASIGAVIPNIFGKYGAEAIGLSPWLKSLVNPATDTDHVLIIIRLSGGNDGLNTVIPLDQYSKLSAARSNILIAENKVLKLNGTTATGLHPAMTGMQTLYNEGKVRIVQGVGYPSQSFSHFRSTDIYMTGADSDQNLPSGWMGRYLTTEYPNYPVGYPNATMPDPLAIQLNDMSLTFEGISTTMGLTVSDPTKPYNFLDDTNNVLTGNMGDELNYLRLLAKQSDRYGEGIQAAYARATNLTTYPTSNKLADQLKIVARLIKGGLKTRVYMVQMTGFDTHAGQVDTANPSTGVGGSHAALLDDLSQGILAFQRDIEAMRLQDRVLGMTFSEFGRRIKSNGSVGTDHGASYPMFLFGSRVVGGLSGTNPQIPTTVTDNSNVPMQHDFRSVYASVLEDWFCVNSTDLQATMLKNYQKLPIINSPSCIADSHVLNVAAGIEMISNYPNPFDFGTTIEFESRGGFTSIQIFDTTGRLIATPITGEYTGGRHKVFYNGSHLPVGIYYARLQNNALSQVLTMMKVQ
jgi:uncharacterized protein (DUF1501 family)